MRVSCGVSGGNLYMVHSTPLKWLMAKGHLLLPFVLPPIKTHLPNTNPKFPLTSAQLVGFNNESFQRPFLIYVPINVEIPTGTHYYTNDRDYEGKVWLNVDTIVTSATMFTNGPTDTIIFHWHNPSGRTVALGSPQPLTEMSTANISRGVKAAVA